MPFSSVSSANAACPTLPQGWGCPEMTMTLSLGEGHMCRRVTSHSAVGKPLFFVFPPFRPSTGTGGSTRLTWSWPTMSRPLPPQTVSLGIMEQLPVPRSSMPLTLASESLQLLFPLPAHSIGREDSGAGAPQPETRFCHLLDDEQVPTPFCASVSSCIKWG